MIVGISGLLVTEDGTPVGTAGAGKDSFADALVANAGFKKIALADPLKRVCLDVYRMTVEQLWGPSQNRNAQDTRYPRPHTWNKGSCACCGYKEVAEAPQCFLTPRYALQLLGTEWGRECYPDTWVQVCMNNAQDLLGEAPKDYSAQEGIIDYSRLDDGSWRDSVLNKCKGVAVPDVRFPNEVTGLRARGAKLIRVRRVGAGLTNAAGLHPSERESVAIPDSAFDHVIENNGTLEELGAQITRVLSV